MARLELPNLPDSIYRRLQLRAEREGRSLDEVAVECLDSSLEPEPSDHDALMKRIRERRERMHARGMFLTDEMLREMRDTGRE